MTTISETRAQKRVRLERRDKYRDTVCSGCHYNYYNFAKEADRVGVAIPDDYSCWYVTWIKQGRCPMKR